jgi:hypothetical protein
MACRKRLSLLAQVLVIVVNRFAHRTHSEWTVERHHFQTQYGDSLETIDDDLVVILESLDDVFAAIARLTIYVLVRVLLGGPHHGIFSFLHARCGGLEPAQEPQASRAAKLDPRITCWPL